jgi:hypothetical protein
VVLKITCLQGDEPEDSKQRLADGSSSKRRRQPRVMRDGWLKGIKMFCWRRGVPGKCFIVTEFSLYLFESV